MDEMTYAFDKIKEIDPSCYIDSYIMVAECSKMHTPKQFIIRLLELLKKACPYDEAVAFFLDLNGKVIDYHLVKIKKERIELYLNYYLELMNKNASRLSLNIGENERSGKNFSNIIDWSQVPDSQFKSEYVDSHRLKYSWGFCFFDGFGIYRVVLSLDRTRPVPFSEAEKNRLEMSLPILNNMYRMFFYPGQIGSDPHRDQTSWKVYGFTTRETEIAVLLCQGMTAQNIGKALCISVTTAYKHIAHIFKKANVSSQQELIVKLLNHKNI